jgi:glutathione synthase/RimK-type ligase-like ATP-grasp enzyme
MKVLITCARAPVSIEWILIFQKANYQIVLTDSLAFPITKYCKNVTFVQTASPRFNFVLYKKQMLDLIKSVDLVIPNCEDIFYLTQIRDDISNQVKLFMPEDRLLFALHNKYTVSQYLNQYVRFPKTNIIYNKQDICIDNNTILKPVFSRFGKHVVRDINIESIENLEISKEYPWVQQEKIVGEPICNYALLENGKVIAHSAYKPRYLLNGAAATYFESYYDDRLEQFIQQFALDTDYVGQVAFDFIDDGNELYVLECNPRATSGLHLMRNFLSVKEGEFIYHNNSNKISYRIGMTLYIFFGLKALFKGDFFKLSSDYKYADDVLSPLPWYAQPLSLMGMILRAISFKKDITTASTFDIEYDG